MTTRNPASSKWMNPTSRWAKVHRPMRMIATIAIAPEIPEVEIPEVEIPEVEIHGVGIRGVEIPGIAIPAIGEIAAARPDRRKVVRSKAARPCVHR